MSFPAARPAARSALGAGCRMSNDANRTHHIYRTVLCFLL
jgi:hypothetical protein